MKRTKWITTLFTCLLLIGAARAYGGDVEFKFDIPTIPFTPVFSAISNSSAVEGPDSTFTVYVKIDGQEQLEACCNGTCVHQCEPNCDFSACEMADYTGQADPRIIPNPTCIPSSTDSSGGSQPSVCGGQPGNPKVFYYFDGDLSDGGSAAMTYNSTTQKFEGVIDIGGRPEETVVTYYFVAVDNRGNVASQVPSLTQVPCSTMAANWDTDFMTAPTNNCTYMNSYERCGRFYTGTPTCGSDYTINDPSGDTCDVNGDVTSGVDNTDVLGISAGAGPGFQDLPGKTVVCSQIKLGANPPDSGTSDGPIEAYVMVFFNPDILDPNPSDLHMLNAFAITYAPEVSGADPNLVKVLWDGDCATDPNTADILSCKIFIGGMSESRVQISAAGGILKFIAQNDLEDSKSRSLLGSSTNSTRAVIASGEIDLNGSTPFWLVDMTSGIGIVRSNQEAEIGPQGNPAAPQPLSPSACKWPDGTEYTSGTCDQSATKPTKNSCYLTIYPSPDANFTGQYNIYHNTTGTTTTDAGDLVGSITTNIASTNYYTYDVSSDSDGLDGKKHYFYLTSVNSTHPEYETETSKAATTWCTVEDWVAPDPPTGMACVTPDGNEGSCKCDWNADTTSDPSLRGFNIYRDSVRQNTNLIGAVVGLSDYNYTDSDTSLVLGTSYAYTVNAIDAGSNLSADAATTCTPEDRKKPGKIGSLAGTLQSGAYGIDLQWSEGDDTDIEGYNVYKCEVTTSATTECVTKDDYLTGGYNEKINGSLITTGSDLKISSTSFPSADTDFCFWVEACDTCVTDGTCPSNSGSANCSNIDTSVVYRKCMTITAVPEKYGPNFPTNQVVTPPGIGKSCELTWTRTCASEDFEPPDTSVDFINCDYPKPMEIMGYYVLRTEAVGGECTAGLMGTPGSPGNNTVSDPVQVDNSPSYTDTGLTNDTKYCYLVFGFDAGGKFSSVSAPDPIACTPKRTLAPNKPVLGTVGYSYDDISCTPDWDDVTDVDTITYTVLRCNDLIDDCTVGDFASITEATNITATTYEDISEDLVQDGEYTYCITAHAGTIGSDPFNGDKENCKICILSNRPAPPVAKTAWETVDQFGAVACWDPSPDESGGGYNVYACTGNTYAQDADDSGSGCTKLNTSLYTGSHSCTSGSEWTIADAGMDTGTYYIGVTYVNASGQDSFPSYTSSSITINASYKCNVEPMPSECTIEFKLSMPLTKLAVTACSDFGGSECCEGASDCTSNGYYKKIVEKLSGIPIELVPLTSGGRLKAGATTFGDPVTSGKTGTDGKVTFYADPADLTAGTNYVFRIKYSTFDTEMACDNDAATDGYCSVALTDATDLSAGGAANIAVAPAPKPPTTASGGFGAEIGNYNGDGNVNMTDFALFKAAYNTTKGGSGSNDKCYSPLADFDMDGSVGMSDLLVLKQYYNLTLGAAPASPLISSKTTSLTYDGDADSTNDCCDDTGGCN